MTTEAKAKFTVTEKDGVVTLKRGDFEIRFNESNDDVTVRTAGTVVHEQIVPPALPEADKPLALGDMAEDGSIYAGVINGFKVFAAPLDLTNRHAQHLTTGFNDAARRVQRLNTENYLGHNDWQVPALDVMSTIRANKETGAFKDSFKPRSELADQDYPYWYWTSTLGVENKGQVLIVNITDDKAQWQDTDSSSRLSTRAIRLEKI